MDQFEEKKWFVFLGDHHEGPFSMAEMLNKVDQRVVNASSFVWAEGMTDWKLLKEIPAFDGSEKKGTVAPAAPKLSAPVTPVAPAASTGMPEVISLQLDKSPLRPVQMPPLTNDQIEKSWKRRKFFRSTLKTAAMVTVVGGAAFVYKQGMLDSYLTSETMTKAIATTQAVAGAAMDRARPQLLALSEKYPVLSKVISPIPRLKDVSPEDYDALRAAVSAHLDQGGPVVAVVAAKGDPARPVFYVSSNLPDGAKFDVYLEGVRDTLIGKLSASAKATVMISKGLGQTEALHLASDAPLPMGEYQVFATESDGQPDAVGAILKNLPPLNAAKTDRLPAGLKLLARKTYFFGGPKDEGYAQKLRDYHTELSKKAAVEIADLKDMANVLNQQMELTIKQFKSIHKGRASASQKKKWASFHESWMRAEIALLDRLQKLTPEILRDDYVYGDHYEAARQTSRDLQKLHDMQNDFFENRLDEHSLDIQLGSATSVVESTFIGLKTKIEQSDKKPAAQNGTGT